MTQELYAAWKYDTFPYILLGEITEFVEDGKVHVKGYTGMRFKPVKVMTAEEGKAIQKALNDYTLELAEAQKNTRECYIQYVMGEMSMPREAFPI